MKIIISPAKKMNIDTNTAPWQALPAYLRQTRFASKEYSRCIFGYHKRKEQGNFVTCVFGECQDGKIVEKGTLAKMARGEMVRYLAEMQAEDTEAVKRFQRLDYRFAEAYSDDKTLVFLKEQRGYKDEGEHI